MRYKFIDLFAGIGGFRQGFEQNGHKCVFTSEIDEHAQDMYNLNYPNSGKIYSDITKIDENMIPHHDIILAGFPCQPFSIAGSKKGFEDTRGTLFFDILRIAKHHRPKAIVLENVKNFKSHDKGKTLQVVINSLEEIGYTVSWSVLNAKDFGVPQNRERTIIIALKNDKKFDFTKLEKQKMVNIESILEQDEELFEYLNPEEYTLIPDPKVQKSGLIFQGYLNKNRRTNGVRAGTDHLSRSHKQPNRIYSAKGTHPTLSSQESAGRYYIHHENRVRKLTIRECYRLMGFQDDFKFIGTKAKLYNRIGNSIVVPMVKEICRVLEKEVG